MSPAVVVLLFLVSEPPPHPKSVPAYTNDDLDRLAPRRGEGGVFVTGPATTPPSRGEEPAARRGTPERGEEYWRREAEKVRDRVRPLQEKADLLRARISDRQRKPGVRPFSDPGVRALQDELGRLLQRAREIEEGLEDRARRAGALPGWLR